MEREIAQRNKEPVDRSKYPENVLWEPSPHGYYYNGGTPEKVQELQAYMVERGFTPPVVLCQEHRGIVYYTPKDATWTDTIVGASFM